MTDSPVHVHVLGGFRVAVDDRAPGPDDAVVLESGQVRLFPEVDVHTDLAGLEAGARANLDVIETATTS